MCWGTQSSSALLRKFLALCVRVHTCVYEYWTTNIHGCTSSHACKSWERGLVYKLRGLFPQASVQSCIYACMYVYDCFWALTSSVLCFPDQSLKGKGKVSVKVWQVIVMVMVPYSIMFPKVTLINLCVPKQVDRCEGWCLAQRSVGQSMVSKLKAVGTASSMESVPTYTRYYTDISRQRKRQVGDIQLQILAVPFDLDSLISIDYFLMDLTLNKRFPGIFLDKNVQKSARKTLQINMLFCFFLHQSLKQLQPCSC